MKLKTAITLLVFSLFGYFGYGLVSVHTSADVITYKSFSKALMQDDRLRAQRLAANSESLKIFDHMKERKQRYEGRIKFTYHQVLDQEYSADGDIAHLKVRQVTRIDPEGVEPTFWGTDTVEEIHNVSLQRTGDRSWRVTAFSENPVRI